MTLELWNAEKKAMSPPGDDDVATWSNGNIVLLPETSREPGPYRWQRTPYARVIMNLYKHPDIRHLVLKWATQIGKSVILYNILGYIIDEDPYSTLLVYPSDDEGRRVSRTRLQTLFEACQAIADKIPKSRAKYQLEEMAFPGMVLYVVGANSPTPMAQKPCRNVIRDEINKFPKSIKGHGNPLALSEERFKAFYDIRKLIDVSSPTTEDGNITVQEASCQVILKYFVVCPFCKRLQTLEFNQIHYEDREKLEKADRIHLAATSAVYVCKYCEEGIDDRWKEWMMAKENGADWCDINNEEPEPSDDPMADIFEKYKNKGVKLEDVASRLSSLYSPFLRWGDIVKKYLTAELAEVDKFDLQRAFITDWLGEEYVPKISAQSDDDVLKHRTDLPPLMVPDKALALTMGVDVHKRHLEYVIRAWARDYENWLIRYGHVLLWEDIYRLIFEDVYPIENSVESMRVWRCGIDTGGGETDDEEITSTEEVYTWLRNYGRGVCFGVKGSSHPMATRIRETIIDKMPGRAGKVIPGGLVVYVVDTAEFKDTLHFRLQVEDGQAQSFHLHAETGKDYSRQITAEEKRRDDKGKTVWHKKRANHYLDCEVYAAACADIQWRGGIRVLRGKAGTTGAPPPTIKTPQQGSRWVRDTNGWFNR